MTTGKRKNYIPILAFLHCLPDDKITMILLTCDIYGNTDFIVFIWPQLSVLSSGVNLLTHPEAGLEKKDNNDARAVKLSI